MQPETNLSGKVVLVTGAGSGLGEATARAFAEQGCLLACVDIQQVHVERVSNELVKQGRRSIALLCNVADEQQVFGTVMAAKEQLGSVDILVNCAAVDYTYSVEELSIEQWDRAMAVNLRGPFLFAKAVYPFMREQHYGHIFNIASTAALRAWANASIYHATKMGLVGFSRGLSVEGRPHGIRVTTIFPGGMRTHFFDRFVAQGIPLPDEKNLQDPATVAAAIVYAAKVPAESAIQELLLTPFNETSWP